MTMKRMVYTGRGYTNIAQIATISERRGKEERSIAYDRNGRSVGELLDDEVEALQCDLIPNTRDIILLLFWVVTDNDGVPHLEHTRESILAWRVTTSFMTPVPITATAGNVEFSGAGAVLHDRAADAYYIPDNRSFANWDDVQKYVLPELLKELGVRNQKLVEEREAKRAAAAAPVVQ